MSLRFPFFVDLSGKKAVVVGGGTVGLRRARVLRDFGAAVTVVAPSLGAPLEGLAHIARRYQAGDLAEAFLAVAATDDRAVNRAVWEEAQGRGVWVNVCDCQSECGFFFPAICRTGNLVAGVAGDGTDHRRTAQAAAAIRKALEELP